MAWSNFQNDIFTAVEGILQQNKPLVVKARAGTGKTTTMTEAVVRFCRKNPRAKVLTCAFNVKNAKDLDSKLRAKGLDWKQANAKTLNGVAFATCKKAWGKAIKVDGSKGKKIARDLAERYNETSNNPIDGLGAKVAKLASMIKITLTNPEDTRALETLCVDFDIVDENHEFGPVITLARNALMASKNDRMTVDFDDQLWFPYVFGLTPWKHDLVIVDEAQDMNAAQLWNAQQSVKKNGRLIAIGDDRQAIYAWRGADSGFLDRMVNDLGANTLPLPLTYRCGKAIVQEACQIVPDYRAAEGNHEGVVRETTEAKMLDEVKPGDFILSRVNAPLLPLCLGFLKEGIPAIIQGRDIMGQLVTLINKSKTTKVSDLLRWIDTYEAKERKRLADLGADDKHLEQVSDRCDCIRTLSGEHETCQALIAHLDTLFTDKDEQGMITLSSVHRSKGLERDRVFLMADTLRSGGEEDNIRYVAITRAKHELIYVSA